MKAIDLSAVNLRAPYTIWCEDGEYYFKSDYDIYFNISFEEEYLLESDKAYWFNLANRSNKKSPGDKKIAQTIICLIEGFFDANPDILLYMCDTANDQQAERDRLFLRWFKGYKQKEKYITRSEIVQDEGVDNYVSIIIQRSNPHAEKILATFEEQINLFKQNK